MSVPDTYPDDIQDKSSITDYVIAFIVLAVSIFIFLCIIGSGNASIKVMESLFLITILYIIFQVCLLFFGRSRFPLFTSSSPIILHNDLQSELLRKQMATMGFFPFAYDGMISPGTIIMFGFVVCLISLGFSCAPTFERGLLGVGRLWFYATLGAIVTSLGVIFLLKKKPPFGTCFSIIVFVWFISIPIAYNFNMYLDKSNPIRSQLKVIGKNVLTTNNGHNGSHVEYKVSLTDARYNVFERNAPEQIYDALRIGDTLCEDIYQGFFSVPWRALTSCPKR